MITNEKMEKALHDLESTDVISAELKADVERREYMFKRAKALCFKLAEGTVADRNAQAETAAESLEAAEKWFIAIKESEEVRAKRQTSALIVEVWRSMNANRRTGNIS